MTKISDQLQEITSPIFSGFGRPANTAELKLYMHSWSGNKSHKCWVVGSRRKLCTGTDVPGTGVMSTSCPGTAAQVGANTVCGQGKNSGVKVPLKENGLFLLKPDRRVV